MNSHCKAMFFYFEQLLEVVNSLSPPVRVGDTPFQ